MMDDIILQDIKKIRIDLKQDTFAGKSVNY